MNPLRGLQDEASLEGDKAADCAPALQRNPEQMVAGEIETYIGYRSLYALWCGNNAAVQELRPMFRIASIEPDGVLYVTEEFKGQVISMARNVLASFSE